jgi:hypothetical protein
MKNPSARLLGSLVGVLSLVALPGCDQYKSMEATALAFEPIIGRILLKNADAPWRYVSRVMGTCAEAFGPKYCMPVRLRKFRALDWRPGSWQKYQATYAIHGGTTTQCETLGSKLADIKAEPALVGILRSTEQLDTEYWKAHTKLMVGPELSLVAIQNEYFNPRNANLFRSTELTLRTLENAHIDCALRTITLVLGWP